MAGKTSAPADLNRCDEASAMDNQLEILEAQALKLSAGERAACARPLLASLDEDTEMEEAWATEIERRIADVEKWCCSGYCHCRCSCPASRRVEMKPVVAAAALADPRDAAAFHTAKADAELGLAPVAEFERSASLILANPRLYLPWRPTPLSFAQVSLQSDLPNHPGGALDSRCGTPSPAAGVLPTIRRFSRWARRIPSEQR